VIAAAQKLYLDPLLETGDEEGYRRQRVHPSKYG